jgi:virginiamycin A acetyltransferase
MDINSPYLFQIGRYTSIGDNLTIVSNLNHDYKSVFQGVIPEFADDTATSFRLRKGQNDANLEQKGMVLIGNDVWIGDDVTIVSEVTIGNGAVIAARSVVVSDVPPYSIYGGNPARFIKSRFDDETIGLFQKIMWWDFAKEKILEAKEDMMGDPQDFVHRYGKLVEYYENSNVLNISHKGSIPSLLAFIDAETQYNSFGNVLVQFCKTFADGQAQLILCYNPGNEAENETAMEILKMASELPKNMLFRLVPLEPDIEEAAISEVDYLIVGRGTSFIKRVSYAFKYGVPCISGVDMPLFNSKMIEKIKG